MEHQTEHPNKETNLTDSQMVECGREEQRARNYGDTIDWHRKAAELTDSVINNLISNMVYVEGGSYIMGSKGKESNIDEKPIHRETISPFHIGKFEVTQKEWEVIMGTNPSLFKGDDLPVENVSWNDCHEFILKLNTLTGKRFRLPTEAEWEYASRVEVEVRAINIVAAIK